MNYWMTYPNMESDLGEHWIGSIAKHWRFQDQMSTDASIDE